MLAELLGAAELGKDELLLRLRELGLITYPSRLLWRLLEDLPAVLAVEVMSRLDPADNAVLAQVARPWMAVVLTFGLRPARGKDRGGAAQTLGIPSAWRGRRRTGARGRLGHVPFAARGGHLEAPMYAREQGCPWGGWNLLVRNEWVGTCEAAARGGTWRCCSGRGSTAARGRRIGPQAPLILGTWRC